MSLFQNDDVHCAHNNDLCNGFEYFSKNKEEQLRQLKPFADKDSAYLTDLIRKAWNSFSANDKAIYHEEAGVVLPEVEKRAIVREDSDADDYDAGFSPSNNDGMDKPEVDKDNAKLLPKSFGPVRNYRYGRTYPAIIYIIEMNSILLQDKHFASSQKGLIKMLWLKGWILLSQEQREEYAERSRKNWTAHTNGSTYQQIADAEFADFVEALDPEADVIAVRMLSEDLCSHELFGSNYMGEQLFYKFTSTQRDEYYEMAHHHRVDKKACELFEKEELSEHVKGSYCMECDFKNLNATKKKYYLEKAEEIIQKYQDNLRKGIRDTASIEDYDAIPVLKEMIYPDSNDKNLCAFNVYLNKMRPLLCQEPGMEMMRCFELNLILKQRWNTLNSEKKQIFYEALSQIADIKKQISERKLKDYNFFQTDNWDEIFYDDLSAEEKLLFKEKKFAVRRQLLEDFPDVKDYFYWKHTNKRYPKSIQDPYEYDTTLKEYSGKPFIVRQVFNSCVADWFQTTDPKGIKEHQAFHMFAEEVCTHCGDGLSELSKWERWFELSDDQQAEYYNKLLLSRYKSSALWKYYQKVDPTDDESNIFCTKCGFDSMDKAEKKAYMKKGKRAIQRGLDKDMEKEQRYRAKENRRLRKRYHSWPKEDTKKLYVKHVEACFRPKMLVNPNQSLEWNAFYPYFRKHIKSFSKDPENQHLPYSRICEKVEQSFWDLPDAERKQYFDTVLRYVELKKQMEPLRCVDFYLESMDENRELKTETATLSDSDDDDDVDRALNEKKMMQARAKLLHDNPDLTDYFYFEKSLNCSSNESDDDDEDSTDEEFREKLVPTPFMCYVQAVRPLMEQEDPEFAEMYPFEQRWAIMQSWKKLSKKQKAVYYEKHERVEGRVKVKQLFKNLSCI
uniref:HMG box domain-containing protein n=1 Tax=Panagrellus redivivus TaxID=6233 RepID=A0A7E4VHB3_PANRE